MVDLATVAQIVFAGALFVATAVLAWYTSKMAYLGWAQFDWSVRPVVVASLKWVGPTVVFIEFENVGNGAALDVRVTVDSEPAGLAFEWAFPALLPKQTAQVRPPGGYMQMAKLLTLDRIRVGVRCVDFQGLARPGSHILELAPFRTYMDRAMTLYEDTSMDLLEKQVAQLKEIASQLGKLTSLRSEK